MSDWEHLDWQALAGLRERFLSGRADGVDYWQSDALISAYDATFAQRIGWKWDAVLAETKARDWQPPHATLVIDWGCGSGIASRALVEAFPELASAEFLFFDQSRIASTYAANRMAQRFPQSSATATTTLPDAHTCNKAVVLLSHVINELNLQQQTMLAETLLQAQTVIWVEPGARAESERLLVVREQLRPAFHLWAPCPHQHLCPLLKTPGSDWCHHFAHPPPEVFTDPNWAKFGKWMGVDLRSLPFSYLVCDKRPETGNTPQNAARILGRPREYHGYMKILSCEPHGVQERILQKRDDKALYKRLHKAKAYGLEAWILDGEKIKGSTPTAGNQSH